MLLHLLTSPSTSSNGEWWVFCITRNKDMTSPLLTHLCLWPFISNIQLLVITFYRKAVTAHGGRWWSLAILTPTPSLVWSPASLTRVSWSVFCGSDTETSHALTSPPLMDHVSWGSWQTSALAELQHIVCLTVLTASSLFGYFFHVSLLGVDVFLLHATA